MLTQNPKSKFEIALQEFNYSEGLNTLRTFGLESPQSKSIDREQSTHMDFLRFIGLIVRQGLESEQCAIKTAIFRERSGKALSQNSNYEASLNAKHHHGNQNVTPNAHPTESNAPDIALYTMALKERGDLLGVVPAYIEETLKLSPPTFKVTVKFQDITSQGFGRTKRLAKHEASKNACEFLGLKVL